LSLLVPDYDETIEYYTRVLGFELIEDTDHGGGSRWNLLEPKGYIY
jgi:catechol 2,3-dioxygenase-like lactoylglutathione lyase family enzyme